MPQGKISIPEATQTQLIQNCFFVLESLFCNHAPYFGYCTKGQVTILYNATVNDSKSRYITCYIYILNTKSINNTHGRILEAYSGGIALATAMERSFNVQK